MPSLASFSRRTACLRRWFGEIEADTFDKAVIDSVRSDEDIPMMQTLIDHPAALIAFLLLVALTFASHRLGLTAWLAWLDRHKGDRREQKRHGEATKDDWRVRQ